MNKKNAREGVPGERIRNYHSRMPKWLPSLAAAFFAQTALAQQPVAPRAVAQKPVAAPVAGQPGAAAAPAAAATVAEPVLPTVADPLLEPVPPAAKVLGGWREALKLLRDNSNALRTLELRTESARAEARRVLSGALPSLTGDAGLNHHFLKGERQALLANGNVGNVTAPDPATTFNAGLNLRVPLLALEAWHNHGTAEDQINVAQLNTKAGERLYAANVADAVVVAVTAERLAEVSRVSLESALSTLTLYQRRAALGAASAIDVLRIEQEASLARGQVVTANDSVLIAREQLGAALGSSDPYGVTPNINLDALANDAKNSCKPSNEIADRADVRAAEASVGVAQRNVESVNRTYWPTIDAVSSLTYWSDDTSTANNEHVTWTIGGVLSWTLYDGGLRYGTRQAREVDVRIANEQLADTKRAARLQVTQAFRTVRVAEQALEVSRRTQQIAGETARLSKVAYLNGSGTTFDLVDTARQKREADLDATIKEFGVLRAKIAALLALANCDV